MTGTEVECPFCNGTGKMLAPRAKLAPLDITLKPMISVITPTHQGSHRTGRARQELIMERCHPSVQEAAREYGGQVRHIIISEADDDVRLRAYCDARGFHWPAAATFGTVPPRYYHDHYGTEGRNKGLELATGDLIAYLDDDDAFRPQHLKVLAGLLEENPEAQWAYAAVEWHKTGRVSFADPPEPGNVSSMVMHRASLSVRWEGDVREDWNLVKGWLDAGIPYACSSEVTADAY